MTYRIIQWGTGNVGKHALRTIIERPSFELVGVRVYNPEKVGKDAGELIGAPATGVTATDDVDAIVALDADCVCYTSLGTTLMDVNAPLDDICRLLASGKNVVSSAFEYFAYLKPGVAPGVIGPEVAERLEAACREGATSFYHVGINPGFTMDAWPIQLSRLSRRIERITVTELVDMTAYDSREVVVDALGFGKPADFVNAMDLMMGSPEDSPFAIAVHLLADAIGFEIDDFRYTRDVALTEVPLVVAVGEIEAGTVAAQRFRMEGLRNGRAIVDLYWVWRLSDEVAPEWPQGESRWILAIDGDPKIESDLVMSTDYGRAVSLTVATLALNAVPVVCAAAPGTLHNLSIPVHGGGHILDEGQFVL